MRRLSGTAVALAAAAALIAGGGAYALASSTGAKTITVCVKHNGGVLYRAKRCARHDKKLTWNRQGLQGVQGEPAAVQVAGWSGLGGTVPASSKLVFIGPTATVTTTVAAPTIVASGSVSLATSAGSAVGLVGICYQASTGGALSFLDNHSGESFEDVMPNTTPTIAAASQAGAPGTGTWKIGMCGVDEDDVQPWDDIDTSIGWAMVTGPGSPTSQ